MLGNASVWSGRRHSAVAGLLRRNEPVHAQGLKVGNRPGRVLTGGGYLPGPFAGVADGLLNHDHGLPFGRGQIGGPRRHDHLVSAVHLERRLDGLSDEPRSGRPSAVTDDDVERAITLTLETTPKGATIGAPGQWPSAAG